MENRNESMPFYDELPTMSPQLIAEVTLYSTSQGGKKMAAQPGWGCPCTPSKTSYVVGDDGVRRLFCYDGWPLLKEPISPGDSRRLGFVFLAGQEAADALRKAGTFYLWEGRFIGEANVIE